MEHMFVLVALLCKNGLWVLRCILKSQTVFDMASKKLKVHGAKHCKTSIVMCTYCRPTFQKISVTIQNYIACS